MNSLRAYRKLGLLLIGLLIANTSFAFESIAHDSHQHDRQSVMHGTSDISADIMQDSSIAYSENPSFVSTTGSTAEQASEDCICDELCCVSSVDFGAMTRADQSPQLGNISAVKPTYYQSISLDLLLPPPNR